MKKQIKRARRGGMSNLDILKVKEMARRETQKMEAQAVEKAFLYMVEIPLNILVHDYWSKSAKKKAPEFIKKVMNLFEAVEQGVVDHEDLHQVLYEYTGISLKEEWMKNKEVEVESGKRIYKL